MASPFLPQLTWRTGTAAVLVFVALIVWTQRSKPAPVPEEHINGEAGFGITPPPGWTRRQDDADGSRILPGQELDQGVAWLVVSARMAKDPSPLGLLHEIAARPAAGPIRDLKWLGQERATLANGADAAIGEFVQTEHGQAMHGWMVVTVQHPQMLQAVVVVPERAAKPWRGAMLEALLSLRSI